MSKDLVISASAHETRVAILEEGQLCEIYIEREKEFALVGSIYKGRVTRVLPGMQSAFVDIGLDSDAFLYVSDFLENLEEYDHVVSTVENKVEKMQQQGGEVFSQQTEAQAAPSSDADAGAAPDAAADAGAAPSPEAGAEPSHEFPNDPPQPQSNAGNSFNQGPGARPGSRGGYQDRHGSRGPGGGQGGSNRPGGQGSSNRPAGQGGSSRPGGYENRGGSGDRGGSSDRGGPGGRRGRWGRGGRDDRRRGGGARDLPSSKYASPRAPGQGPGDQRSGESRPFQPRTPYEPPADYVPVILPGESLAKYKDRVPGQPLAPTAPAAPESNAPTAAESSLDNLRDQTGPAAGIFSDAEPPQTVPSAASESLLAGAAAIESDVHSESHAESLTEPDSPAEIEAESEMENESPAPAPLFEPHAAHDSDLSADEVTSLAEQLAEAKHEEAQAQREEAAQDALDASQAEPFSESHESSEGHSEFAGFDVHDREHGEHDDAEHRAESSDESAAHLDAEHEDQELSGASDQHEHESDQPEGQEDHDDVQAAAENESQSAGNFGGERQPDASAMPDAPGGSNFPPSSARVSQPPRARFNRPMRRGGRNNRDRDRSGRPPMRSHSGPRHDAPRRPQLISEMLKAGQEIIVQIAKEPLGKKGARITSHVALPGRFLVYMPTVDHIGVSRRIGSAEDRSRLRRLVSEAKGTYPGGFIVRTAAGGATDDEIRADVEFLGHTWDKIRNSSEQRHAPDLLHRDLNLVERILRDYLSQDYAAIWIDNEEEYGKVVEFVNRFQPKLVGRVKLYTKETPIFEEFGIQQELDKALRPKVWLKSGGYIVINHTEALVAIDVNTGKYVGKGSTRLEDTIVKTNVEAVKEVVRQIRLRDLGGIIVVDFIDMEERRNRDRVMAALDQALHSDRAPSKVIPFNEFGLVNITRKRTKQALERVLCQPCPYCSGSGMVKSGPTICYEIQSEARKMAENLDSGSMTLRVNPEIAKALKTRESNMIEEL
ncbi:MAG: Rne/Rng family ribonuclease, partial [Candidatus Acidiferrales bacterium]